MALKIPSLENLKKNYTFEAIFCKTDNFQAYLSKFPRIFGEGGTFPFALPRHNGEGGDHLKLRRGEGRVAGFWHEGVWAARIFGVKRRMMALHSHLGYIVFFEKIYIEK